LSTCPPVASGDFQLVCLTKTKSNFYFPKATIKLLPEACIIFVAVVVVLASLLLLLALVVIVVVLVMPTQICKMFCVNFQVFT